MADAKPIRAATPTPVTWKDLQAEDIALLTASAKGWKPEVGDEVRGIVLSVKLAYSDVGVKPGDALKEYPIVFVLPDGATTDTAAVAIHAFHSILQNELMSQRPEPGDGIYIQSLGDMGREAKMKGGDPAQVYAVHVTKPTGADYVSPWDVFKRSDRVRMDG